MISFLPSSWTSKLGFKILIFDSKLLIRIFDSKFLIRNFGFEIFDSKFWFEIRKVLKWRAGNPGPVTVLIPSEFDRDKCLIFIYFILLKPNGPDSKCICIANYIHQSLLQAKAVLTLCDAFFPFWLWGQGRKKTWAYLYRR